MGVKGGVEMGYDGVVKGGVEMGRWGGDGKMGWRGRVDR